MTDNALPVIPFSDPCAHQQADATLLDALAALRLSPATQGPPIVARERGGIVAWGRAADASS